jgi:hypothetical protein
MTRQRGRRVRLAAVALGAVVVCILFANRSSKPQTKRVSSILPVPVDVATAPFDVHLWSGHICGSPPNSERAAYFLALLVREYSIYPSEFFPATGLEQIVLCTGLTFESQRRGAIPDFDHNVLYFDVDEGSYDQFYQRRGLHHELYHVVDLIDDGQLYKDETWRKLNPESFRYGNGGAELQNDSSSGNLQHRESGFLTSYSMSGVEEEKAELFSFLILVPKFVGKRAASDRVLANKVARMKSLLVEFCPQLNESFWQKVEAADLGTDSKPYTEYIPIDNPR